MTKIYYKNQGFDFLDMRLEEDNGFKLYGLKGFVTFKDHNELKNFVDMLEIAGVNFLSCRKAASYGTMLRLYRDEDTTHLWYNRKDIVIRESKIRLLVLILRKLSYRWNWYIAKAQLKEYEGIKKIGWYI